MVYKRTVINPEDWPYEYGDMLYRYAYRRVANKENAEDLVQETLLAGFLAYDKFTGKSAVSTWLVGILKHKIIDLFRKQRRDSVILNHDELAEDILAAQFDQNGAWRFNVLEWKTPDKEMENTQFLAVLNQCVARLPQRFSDLLFLRTESQLSTEDCCQLLGFETDNQLWVALSRTRIKLRQCLDVYWFERDKDYA